MNFPPHPNVSTFRPLHLIVIGSKEVYEVLFDLVFCMGEGWLNFSPFFERFEHPFPKWDFWANNLLGLSQVKKFYTWFAYSAFIIEICTWGEPWGMRCSWNTPKCFRILFGQKVIPFTFFIKSFKQSSQMSNLLLSEWHDHSLVAHSL